MARFRPPINPKSPGIQRQARRYERHLRSALAIAARRDSRRDPDLAKIYASAKVEGADTTLCTKTATITFRGKPLPGTYFLMHEWKSLLWFTPRETAEGISFSVRSNLASIRKDQRRRR